MNQLKYFIFLFFIPLLGFGQIENSPNTGTQSTSALDTLNPPMETYKIISIKNDTTHVDTSLTIQDSYRFNYIREDNFEWLSFSNVGRPMNKLAYGFHNNKMFPGFAGTARHFAYMEVEDIKYYHVPTPLTELFFKTTFEQGQILDALFTVNTSKNFNFSLAYRGMKSLGKYQHIQSNSGSFRATVNYQTKNNRYHLKAHFVSQNITNQENGGLNPIAVDNYIAKNEEFLDRSRLEVNFEDAENTLMGKRFFLKHSYQLVPPDSLSATSLFVGHQLKIYDKEYHFNQESSSPLFGPAYENSNLKDEVAQEGAYNEFFAGYSSNTLGKIKFRARHAHYNYGYNSMIILDNDTISNRLIGNRLSLGGDYQKKIGDFSLQASAMLGISGDLTGSDLRASLGYTFGDVATASAHISSNSSAPNFNFLLYQSDYINYNWQNDFLNIDTKQIGVQFNSERLVNISASYTRINNYTYFYANDTLPKPKQYNGIVNYAKVKAQKEFRLGPFGLNNTILYQKVLDGENVLHVPTFVTRNTLYFSDYWFQKALYLQTGFTFRYFTNYKMDGYDAVLAEFYVQNNQEFEGLPSVDFFFNSKIKRTRIFFKIEHLNSLITGNNYFSAPKYPYRDFSIRFGLVWNFFL